MNKINSVLLLLGIHYNKHMLQINSPIYWKNNRWGLKVSALFHISFVLHLYFTSALNNRLSRQIPLRVKELTLRINYTKDMHQCQEDAVVLYSAIHVFPFFYPHSLLQILEVLGQHKFLFWIERKKVSKDLKEELKDTALIRSGSLSKYVAPESNHHISQMPVSLWKTSYKIEWFHRATGLVNAAFQNSDSLFCPENCLQVWCDRKAWLRTFISYSVMKLCESSPAQNYLLWIQIVIDIRIFLNKDRKRKIGSGFDFMNCWWPWCYFENIKSRNS